MVTAHPDTQTHRHTDTRRIKGLLAQPPGQASAYENKEKSARGQEGRLGRRKERMGEEEGERMGEDGEGREGRREGSWEGRRD